MDVKREEFIKELEQKITDQEIEASKAVGRQKNAKLVERELQDLEG